MRTRAAAAVASLLIALVTLNVFFEAYGQPLGFDDAFNLQPAKSLAERFIYQSTYYPRHIYDYRITTNGPIQYVAALGLGLFGERAGLAATVALLTAFAMWASLTYSARAFAAALVLFVAYPTFNQLSCTFFGEITALGLLLLGMHFTRKLASSDDPGERLRAQRASGIAYGLAISTKLVVGVFVPFMLIGLLLPAGPFNRARTLTALRAALAAYGVALLVFAGLFYASVAHSQVALVATGRDSADFLVDNPGLLRFVKYHFWQHAAVTSGNMLSPRSYSAPWVLPLLFASMALLAVRSRGWIPLVAFTLFLIVQGHLHERRLFFAVVPILLIAADLVLRDIRAGDLRHSVRRRAAPAHVLGFALAAGWLWILGSVGAQGVSASLGSVRFERLRTQLLQAGTTDNRFVIRREWVEVAEAIRSQELPIITSGWFQFPGLQLRSRRSFYDRTAPEVAALLRDRPVLLLFDPDNRTWPETSTAMCARTVASGPEVHLCEYDMKLPLDHRWGTQ